MLVIAEIGINHDGDIEKAIHMIDEAANAGADIAKFQHYDAAKLLGVDSPYYEYANACQFTKEELEALAEYCEHAGIEFLVSVFDINDIPWADKLCKRHKVASRMNKDKAFIKALLATGKQVIVSTQEKSPKPIKGVDYMYCVTEYPTKVKKLKDLPCNKNLGLSSHCPSLTPTINAINQGAQIIEHHICFDRCEEGCDKTSSITFEELAALCDYVSKLECKSN